MYRNKLELKVFLVQPPVPIVLYLTLQLHSIWKFGKIDMRSTYASMKISKYNY